MTRNAWRLESGACDSSLENSGPSALKPTLMPHTIVQGDDRFAYFSKI
jgi:hypothetical protein